MYNLYNTNKTDDLGKSDEGDFYLPISGILVELQDCCNKLTGIESNTTNPTITTPVYSCHWDDDNQQWICHGEGS
jgi:hypothetical protein